MYLDTTFGELRLDDMTLWQEPFQNLAKGTAHRDPFREPQHGSRHPDGSHL